MDVTGKSYCIAVGEELGQSMGRAAVKETQSQTSHKRRRMLGTDTNLTKQGRHGAFSSEASTGLTLWGSQQRARAAAVSWSRNRAPMFSKSLTNSKSRNLTYKWHNLNVISLLILEMTKFNLFPLYVISSVWKLHGVFEANKPAPFLLIHNMRDKCSKNSWLCNTASSYRIKTNRKMVKLCIKEFAQKYILD